MFNQVLSQGHSFFLREVHNTLWCNSTGSLACEMNHFVQNKSQTTKALEHWMKKGQLEKLILNLLSIVRV